MAVSTRKPIPKETIGDHVCMRQGLDAGLFQRITHIYGVTI